MNRTLPLVALALLLIGCAHGGRARGRDSYNGPRRPLVDSVTTALWRFDESVGPRLFDSGPFALEGYAGLDTRSEFGRFQRSRFFRRLPESFGLVPWNPLLDPEGSFTVEAWVRLGTVSEYELSAIASRWAPAANEQSWLLGVVGLQRLPPDVANASPGTFLPYVVGGAPGQVMFLFQPTDAGGPRACFSNASLPQDVWTHVAATYDGEVVKLYIDGLLDSQCLAPGGIRASGAPLLIGTVLDERRLSTFAGDLRLDPGADQAGWYSLVGSVDELRLSSTARTRYEATPGQ